jgi:hypothetical protein
MQRWDHGRLSEAQLARVASWLPAPSLVRDLSWNQIDTSVLHVRADERDFIVKAAGPGNHHIGREIAAHEAYTGPLALRDAAAKLVAADRRANVALLTYLEGRLVEGTEAEHAADTYAQAGRLLRSFHAQETLRRGSRGRQVEGAQLSLELGVVEASAGGEPVARGELEVTTARPVRDDADQVAEVRLRIEPVEPSRGDQRHHIPGGLGVVVTAHEEPRLSFMRFAA